MSSNTPRRILVTPRSLTEAGLDNVPELRPLPASGYQLVAAPAGRVPTEGELLELVPGCVGWLAGVERIGAGVLEAAKDLRVISRNGAGTDAIDLEAAARAGVRVERAAGANAQGVAELALALALSALRHIPWSAAAIRSGGWRRWQGRELHDCIVGVVGLGAIGRRVAGLFDSLGSQVVAYDPFAPAEQVAPIRRVDLDELLTSSDIISLHAPPSADGRPLLDAARMAVIVRGAVLVNTARSALVEDDAVLAALEDGTLSAYAVDAFDSEPSELSPLLQHERVLATPHIGGYTTGSVRRATALAVEHLLAVLGPAHEPQGDVMSRTFHYDTLEPASKPTFYFVGVTTGRSSIRTVFPQWARHLGIQDVELVGIDLPPHAPPQQYRAVVQFLKDDKLSLGGLVTTHKIDLYLATEDFFDYVDPLARLMGEVSCLSKEDGQFRGHAKDPYSSGLALDAFLPPGYWITHSSDVFIIGAGGSAIAIDWYLSRPERGSDRPRRVVVSNRSPERLEKLRKIHEQAANEVTLETVSAPRPTDNDDVLTTLPPYSVVINATGLGKDAPGSPLTDDAVFPSYSVAWDLNYRGDLIFLEQARKQQEERFLRVEDGWIYFIHGWTQVISEVFHIDIPTSGPEFDQLANIAAASRA